MLTDFLFLFYELNLLLRDGLPPSQKKKVLFASLKAR